MKRKSITPVWCTPAETMPRTATDRTTELPGSPHFFGWGVLDIRVKGQINGVEIIRAFGFDALWLKIENFSRRTVLFLP